MGRRRSEWRRPEMRGVVSWISGFGKGCVRGAQESEVLGSR